MRRVSCAGFHNRLLGNGAVWVPQPSREPPSHNAFLARGVTSSWVSPRKSPGRVAFPNGPPEGPPAGVFPVANVAPSSFLAALPASRLWLSALHPPADPPVHRPPGSAVPPPSALSMVRPFCCRPSLASGWRQYGAPSPRGLSPIRAALSLSLHRLCSWRPLQSGRPTSSTPLGRFTPHPHHYRCRLVAVAPAGIPEVVLGRVRGDVVFLSPAV